MRSVCVALVAACVLASTSARGDPRSPVQGGIASVYDEKAGIRTASGDRLATDQLTAAHPSLPFHTRINVLNLINGRSVTVRINDRGPFARGRVIDLTPAAARALHFSGLAPVMLTIVPAN